MPALCPSTTTRQNTANRPIGNADFQARQRTLIDRLEFLEGSLNSRNNDTEAMQVDVSRDRHTERQNRRTTRALRGQESIFKVPRSPPSTRPNRMPDFRRNPSRWTKYTLADVSQADMSDRSNTAAAMQFLQSRQAENQPEREELPTRVSFTPTVRRGRQRERQEDDTEPEPVAGPSSQPSIGFGDPCPAVEVTSPAARPVFKDSKLVMPEYVVGEKKKREKKTGPKTERGKELSLSHLLEQDDE